MEKATQAQASSRDDVQALQRWIVDLVAASNRRQCRDRIRKAARTLRVAARELRGALALLNDPWPLESLPCRPAELGAFRSAMAASLEALRSAEQAIPACAPPGRAPRDETDRAPALGRLHAAIGEEARRKAPALTGAELRDLLRSVGQECPPMDAVDLHMSRKRQEEFLRRSRGSRTSRKVTTTVRRRK
jgi:hypothetical protein